MHTHLRNPPERATLPDSRLAGWTLWLGLEEALGEAELEAVAHGPLAGPVLPEQQAASLRIDAAVAALERLGR